MPQSLKNSLSRSTLISGAISAITHSQTSKSPSARAFWSASAARSADMALPATTSNKIELSTAVLITISHGA